MERQNLQHRFPLQALSSLPGCPNGSLEPPGLLHRLSGGSLVPPWCLPGAPQGCPIGTFLPPWCLPGASQAVQMVLSCLPGALQAVQLVPSCLAGASLVPPRLSKWSFPASLVPPWCLAGCPISPFLPSLVTRVAVNHFAFALWVCSPLSKFQWRPARFAPNPGVGPTAVERTASQRPSP